MGYLPAPHGPRQGGKHYRGVSRLAQEPRLNQACQEGQEVNTHLPGHVCEVGPTGLAAWFRARWGREGAVPRVGVGLCPGSLCRWGLLRLSIQAEPVAAGCPHDKIWCEGGRGEKPGLRYTFTPLPHFERVHGSWGAQSTPAAQVGSRGEDMFSGATDFLPPPASPQLPPFPGGEHRHLLHQDNTGCQVGALPLKGS